MRLCVFLEVADVDEAVRVSEALNPWREKVMTANVNTYRSYKAPQRVRQAKILQEVGIEPAGMGKIYRVLRARRSYGESYKTFQRDMLDLVTTGRVFCFKSSGAGGNTTFISIAPIKERPSTESTPPCTSMTCTWKDCSFTAKNMHGLRIHHARRHSEGLE